MAAPWSGRPASVRTPDFVVVHSSGQARRRKSSGSQRSARQHQRHKTRRRGFGLFAGGQQMAGLLVLITTSTGSGSRRRKACASRRRLLGHGRQDPEWSKRFFAKVGHHADYVARPAVYSSVNALSLKAIKAGGTDDPLKVGGQNARGCRSRTFFSRTASCREDGLMVHDVLDAVKKPEESKFRGTIPDPRAYPRRSGIRAAQSGVAHGQRLIARSAVPVVG